MPEITSRLSTALADRYRIERHLGEGGMATVYLAEDLKHKRKVAVKVLRPELAAVLGAERFVQEITTTASLQHPNILPLFDSGEADGFLYYVMPYIEGETLREKLNRETQLDIDEAVKITTEIAEALDAAHQKGVIHRDIKPENILLHSGRPMVADFGIALAVSAAAGGRMTETGLSLGTPHYMSPEQATAEKDITARSDVYSLGSVLYEMLTGEPPHTGALAQAIIMKIVTEEAQPVTELRKSVPTNVAAAVAKALAKLPADRFGTAAQFADALANPAFIHAAIPQTSQASAQPERWRRLALSMGGLAAVMTIMTITLWASMRRQSDSGNSVMRLSTDFFESAQSAFALSPDGSSVVYVGPGQVATQLWLHQFDELRARPIPGTEAAVTAFFSPDGKDVAFNTGGFPGDLSVVSLAGGPARVVVEDSVFAVGGDWGPDGKLYFHVAGGLRRISVNGGPVELVSEPDPEQKEQGHLWVDVLPSGEGALLTISRGSIEESDIGVVRFESGAVQVLTRGIYARYARSGHVVWVTAEGTLMAQSFDLDRMEMRGRAVELVEGVRFWTFTSAAEFTLSTNGTLLYRTGRVSPTQAEWVELNGVGRPIDPDWWGAGNPELSPDGTRLAVSIQSQGRSDVWVKQLDDGPETRLTFDGSVNYRPAWTPDGSAVTFVSDRAGQLDLWMRRADGSAPAERLLDVEQAIEEGFWSHDGQWLVLRVGTGGARDVMAYRPGVDTVPIPLAAEAFNEWAPALSPDGRWLAYVSDQTGQAEVWVKPFPETGSTRWQVSTGGGTGPVWAHNGRELFYWKGANQMLAADVPVTGFSVGEQRVLFTTENHNSGFYHPEFSLHPDNERFVMIRRGEEEPGGLVVVLNFFEELKAKVGN